MSSHSPQPEGQEVGEQHGAEEAVAEKQLGGKGTLEHQPHPQPQQLQPEPCDQGQASKTRQSAVPCKPPGIAELRLVLLGRVGSGKSAAANAVLGRGEFETGDDDAEDVIQKCEKRRGTAAGRQVAVVNTPDWFSSQHPPEEVVSQLSACAALAAPGPHAFLLCVTVDRPADVVLRSLGPLEEAFGPGAVRARTLVLFTHSDRLEESQEGAQGVEDYIVTRRADLVAVAEKCGDHFHVLEMGGGGGAEDGAAGGAESVEAVELSVRELLEKVEQMVGEAGNAHYTSSLFQQAEARVKQRQEEIMKERRERRGEEVEEEWEEEEEREKARDEAERSAGDLQLDKVPSLWLSHSDTPPSFLHSVFNTLAGWLRSFLKFVQGGALLGGVVRVLVGGPLGGLLGATVGSVATEVGKRKHLKKQ
ncbi:GTPase IMAP family member 7 [Anguilla anguilla]|uniref:GTPase IMAP family member 7 n=1 Tax=Anguilla anguilla TaxID=7936 RepID=UPI0015AECBF0|nr:GTPase IMAP family member 7 [Anguilla anguilla]XP_035255002.1 GTPase IMAP family member 7 [Anguilla anguilla]